MRSPRRQPEQSTTLHGRYVATLEDLGFYTKDFWLRTTLHLSRVPWSGASAARRLLREGRALLDKEDEEDEDETRDTPAVTAAFTRRELEGIGSIVPDAYMLGTYVHDSNPWVVVVEVGVTHDLKPEKLESYNRLSWALDSMNAWFHLLHVDPAGNVSVALHDLCDGGEEKYSARLTGVLDLSPSRPFIGRIQPKEIR